MALHLEGQAIFLAIVRQEGIEVEKLLADQEVRIIVEVFTLKTHLIRKLEELVASLDEVDFGPIEHIYHPQFPPAL